MCQGVKCLFLELFNPNQLIILKNCILFPLFLLDQIGNNDRHLTEIYLQNSVRLGITEFFKLSLNINISDLSGKLKGEKQQSLDSLNSV